MITMYSSIELDGMDCLSIVGMIENGTDFVNLAFAGYQLLL
jgi:hypothetical protein